MCIRDSFKRIRVIVWDLKFVTQDFVIRATVFLTTAFHNERDKIIRFKCSRMIVNVSK